MKQVRRKKNDAEQAFIEFSKQDGFEATKRGWPDFLCYANAKVFCVEVKPRTKKLKPSQIRVMEFLSSHGIECHRWDPIKGYTPWK